MEITAPKYISHEIDIISNTNYRTNSTIYLIIDKY
jgi:hypothetical protein